MISNQVDEHGGEPVDGVRDRSRLGNEVRRDSEECPEGQRHPIKQNEGAAPARVVTHRIPTKQLVSPLRGLTATTSWRQRSVDYPEGYVAHLSSRLHRRLLDELERIGLVHRAA